MCVQRALQNIRGHTHVQCVCSPITSSKSLGISLHAKALRRVNIIGKNDVWLYYQPVFLIDYIKVCWCILK